MLCKRIIMSIPLVGAGPSARGSKQVKAILSLGPTVYWPFSDLTGAVAWDRAANLRAPDAASLDAAITGCTLGQPGIGDGLTSYRFDGVADKVAIHSAALASTWSSDEFTIMLWLRAFNAATWTTDFLRLFGDFVDSDNAVEILRNNVNGELRVAREGKNQFRGANWDTGSPLTWIHVAFTVSKVANEHKGYQGGVQQGGTQTVPQNFVGGLSASANIGAAGGGASVWNGWVAHFAYWSGTILTQSQIATVESSR